MNLAVFALAVATIVIWAAWPWYLCWEGRKKC